MKIAVIPGDGVGVEVVPEAVRVLKELTAAFDIPFETTLMDFGAERYLRTGKALPDDYRDIVDSLPDHFSAALFGAGGADPRVPKGESSLDFMQGMRYRLELFANVRPCKLLDSSITPLKGRAEKDIDFVVIRESTEGYSMASTTKFKVGTPQEMEIRPEINTYRGVSRVVRFAFQYARRQGRKRVDLALKGNDDGLWGRVFKDCCEQNLDLAGRQQHIDTLAYKMITSPGDLDVIVSENRAGDILSDVGAAVQGSRGLSPTACVNPERNFAYFEPIHGTAPDISGRRIVNPLAAVMAGKMMLDHHGFPVAAQAVEDAVRTVLREGKVTRDLGGQLSTVQAADAVIAALPSAVSRPAH